jgi:hypothetical protein
MYESVLKIDVLPGSTAKDGREMQDKKRPSEQSRGLADLIIPIR